MKEILKPYSIDVEHEMRGTKEYNHEKYERSKPHILKSIKKLIKNGVFPTLHTMIYGEDVAYYIMTICIYKNHITFWVNENFENNRDV